MSSCGCGTVVAPADGVIEGSSMSVPTAPAAKPNMAPAAPVTPPEKPAAPVEKPAAPVEKPAAPAEKPAAPAVPPLGLPNLAPPVLPDGGGIVPDKPHASMELKAGESGLLIVWVPYEAKVTINGLLTKSTGSKRRFVSYGLRPGYTYKYEVKAEIVRDGKIVEEKQTISLTAGEQGGVAFGFNQPSNEVAAGYCSRLAGLSISSVRRQRSGLPRRFARETVFHGVGNAAQTSRPVDAAKQLYVVRQRPGIYGLNR